MFFKKIIKSIKYDKDIFIHNKTDDKKTVQSRPNPDDEKEIIKQIAEMMIIEGYSFKASCELIDIVEDDGIVEMIL